MIETLEHRRLMSISAYGASLVIYGGSAGDTISVSKSATGLAVSGTAGTGDFAGIKTLVVYGNGGADNVTVADNVTANAFLYGGAGNDSLTGGGGNDGIYGDGGNDVLHGGSGLDRITGGAGSDDIYGDGGTDFIYASGDRETDVIHRDSLDIIFKDRKDILA
jgi:Ca2+-binding RTX toxin-like protein